MRAMLLETRELAPEVRHFVFEIPEAQEIQFKAGQFVSFNALLDGKKITRPYSLASLPRGNRFELCLNRVDEGMFSPHLFDMQPGDAVETSAPLGFFVIRNPAKDALFIATGTGIAPFRPMVREYLENPAAKDLTLLFGIRFENSVYYGDEFEALVRQHPNFRFWPTLSRPETNWQGRTGHVQAHLMEALAGRRDLDIHICGMKAMVDDVRGMLKELGFDRKQIIFEKYD
ncbi:MAG TPA: FAD-binding oxidoreductase [Bryobacteraceae bacterium]